MEWKPVYLYALIPLIIIIVKALQKNNNKKFKINLDETDDGKTNSMEFDEKLESIKQPSFESYSSNLILNLIEEMGYILISNNINSNLDYEITFINYEKKLFDFKRQSTYIKVSGNEKIKQISYTTWSDRYEYGQNSHNDEIAQEFLVKLKEKMSKPPHNSV
ncbi:MAG: hypothetical protein ACKO7P_13180 [Bacteroidota bacterium]